MTATTSDNCRWLMCMVLSSWWMRWPKRVRSAYKLSQLLDLPGTVISCCTSAQAYPTHAYSRTCARTPTHPPTHTHTHTHAHPYPYPHPHTHTHTHIHTLTQAHTHKHTQYTQYTSIYMQIHKYIRTCRTHTRTHMHTQHAVHIYKHTNTPT